MHTTAGHFGDFHQSYVRNLVQVAFPALQSVQFFAILGEKQNKTIKKPKQIHTTPPPNLT